MDPEALRAYVKSVERKLTEGTFIRLDVAKKRELQRLAEEDGRNLSGLLSKIISDWLKSQPKRK